MNRNILYKIITVLTMLLPTSIYIFISATVLSISPTVIFKHVELSDIGVSTVEGLSFVYTNDKEAIITGSIVYNEALDSYGTYIETNNVVQIGNGYYGIKDGVLTDIKALEFQKQTSYKVPVGIIISAIAALLVALVVFKKMEWATQYKRASVMIFLTMTTAVLYVMDTIVSNVLNVFLLATLSWALYLIEYYAFTNMISGKQAIKAESDLLIELKKKLGEY